jgi:hypothetical protein
MVKDGDGGLGLKDLPRVRVGGTSNQLAGTAAVRLIALQTRSPYESYDREL